MYYDQFYYHRPRIEPHVDNVHRNEMVIYKILEYEEYLRH